jgi:hypothetical protein
MFGLVVDESQALPQRCSNIRIGAVLEQQSGKRIVSAASGPVRLRHDASEERRVASEAVAIDFGLCVDV